jgi:hypothetical protein
MSQQISAWFKEKIKDKVTIAVQANGGLLDNAFTSGDEMANTVKFPIAGGQSNMYKLTGAIEPVPVSNPGLSTVTLTMDDYEDAQFWRTQDAYKAGPSEQDTLAQLMAKGVRRKRDRIRLDALDAFYVADGGTNITTIGTGAETSDILHFEEARTQLEALGDWGASECYCLLPSKWAAQLTLYKEFSNSQWVGPSNTQWSEMQRMQMKTLRGVTYIVAPDSYFSSPSGQPTQLVSYMWMKDAMGANTVVNMENVKITTRDDLQGSPIQLKTALSAAAIGIQAKGVKRFLLAKNPALARGA